MIEIQGSRAGTPDGALPTWTIVPPRRLGPASLIVTQSIITFRTAPSVRSNIDFFHCNERLWTWRPHQIRSVLTKISLSGFGLVWPGGLRSFRRNRLKNPGRLLYSSLHAS